MKSWYSSKKRKSRTENREPRTVRAVVSGGWTVVRKREEREQRTENSESGSRAMDSLPASPVFGLWPEMENIFGEGKRFVHTGRYN